MAFDDLDLEFEDEEEQKKKKNDAVAVDVDLEFGAHAETAAKAPERPKAAAPQEPATAPPPSKLDEMEPGTASVKRLDEVRAKMAQAKGSVSAPARPAAAASEKKAAPASLSGAAVQGSSALQLTPEHSELDLAQWMKLVEDTRFEARVQVAVAQEKGEYMAEVLSDAKLMQHQVQNLIMRINQKHPDVKAELVAIQKALADFVAKKRK